MLSVRLLLLLLLLVQQVADCPKPFQGLQLGHVLRKFGNACCCCCSNILLTAAIITITITVTIVIINKQASLGPYCPTMLLLQFMLQFMQMVPVMLRKASAGPSRCHRCCCCC
jgi:hypothetical protein